MAITPSKGASTQNSPRKESASILLGMQHNNEPSLRDKRLDAYIEWNRNMKETGHDRINGEHPIIPNEDGVIGDNLLMVDDSITDEIIVVLETGFPTRFLRTFVFQPESATIKDVRTHAIEPFCSFFYRYLRYSCLGV